MLTIALAQMDIHPGLPRENMENMLAFITRAKAQGAKLIVFPELSISGYLIGDLWEQPAFLRECMKMGETIREASAGITIMFGNVAVDESRQQPDGRPRKYNALFVAHNQKWIGPTESPYPYYVKTLSPNYRFFDEQRYFTSLPQLALELGVPVEHLLSPLTLPFGDESITVAPLICEDSWHQHYFTNPAEVTRAKRPCDLYVNISGSPFTIGKESYRHQLFQQQMPQLGAPLLYVNTVGMQNNGKCLCTFDGQSTIYQVDGTPLSMLPAYQEGMIFTAFSGKQEPLRILAVEAHRQRLSLLPVDMLPTEPVGDIHTWLPLSLDTSIAPRGDIESIYDALIYGIRQMMTRHNISGVLIGASGGIDSAVNAALYTAAIGSDNVYLVTMPSRFNSQETQSAAAQLAHNLNCPFTIYPIEPGVQLTTAEINRTVFIRATGESHTLQLSDFHKENIQARDRSARILAGLASALGTVFSCNGNKTELSIGYATLYGDLAGFLAATADLWKFQVYELAEYINAAIFKRTVIPRETIDVIPSAELSDKQDVTQGLGDPLQYPYHDRLLRSFLEYWDRLTPEDILEAYASGTLEKLLDLPNAITHYFPDTESFIQDLEKWWNLQSGFAVAKRIQSPPLIAVSRRAYGGDLHESQLLPYYTDRYYELKQQLLSKQPVL